MSDTLSRSLRRTLGFTVLYLLATYAGRLTVMDASNLSLVWPAAGVLAVWFTAQRRSPWRWVDAVALSAITMAVNMATGACARTAVVFMLANLVQGIFFVRLFDRWLPQVWISGGPPLTRLAELWRFIAAAAASTVVGAGLGTAGMWLVTDHFSYESALVWLARNTVSILLIGVGFRRIAWLWHSRRQRTGPSVWSQLGPARRIEYIALVAVSMTAYGLVFTLTDGAPLVFALIGLTIWAGLRMRTSFVILHDLAFGTVTMLFTLNGMGPFAELESNAMRALVAQVFVGMVAVAGLALALGRDERAALLEQLRESEKTAVEQASTMTAIFDSMAEGVGVIDEDGRLLVRNPAATRLLGVASADGRVRDNRFYGLFHPDGTPLAEDDFIYRQIFDGRYAEPIDLLIRNPAVPEGRIVQMSGSEVRAADGRRQAVIVFHDVTADRRHRDELASFAGVVAHDLLNPLTTIEGWSEALADDLGGPQGDSVARIQRAATRMRNMINGLLGYTTARDASLSPAAVDLNDVVGDIATARLDQAAGMSAPMPRFEIDDLTAVDADPVLTRQLLENLIGNAIKYTAPGVVPRIAVSCEPATDGFVRVNVDDNGIGIPAGQHEAIFQNFHRAHTGAGYAGTGLGLAICKRIVERHGGTITAAGNDRGGSRMTFTLPLPALKP
ncbi:ATP-binding protein [Actinoplanes sp. NPDC026619]|uniref:ATP-binding protein n=1 Tax=Actinoplanes sp. NPDC026619 TaxID=3155798 RepID=UPI0033D4943E